MKIDWILFPALACAAAVACGRPVPQRVTKASDTFTAPTTDSVRLVARAIAALDSTTGSSDTVKLKVSRFIRNATGTVIDLIPIRLMQGGGGSIRFRRDGSVAEVQLGQ